MKKSTSGFTLVELLIVIVIIAILAAITIVAYNGITKRANDSAVQNDLDQIAKKFQLFKIDSTTGNFPANTTELESLGLKVSKGSYETSSVSFNVLYCQKAAPNQAFAVLATSKSGKKFYVTDTTGISEYTGATSWAGIDYNAMCGSVLPSSASISSGYNINDTTSGPWRKWAGGN